ncbi:adenylate/guanylate cyclase domain-containing protein [uncultured Paraglaciecola sp.]|uniref:adenylate/guanylate cyclase domain-containing protein n=1 Tax=uncultured Paraglaciecola sp. TaxID=1765024 RepID=UPI00260A291A|nr:adenylate/guanylate cyclase domain-containing protein [uncultured Paraglaciecola sp.]
MFNVLISCVLWEINLNIQYFFLIAVFISPFLFYQHERLMMNLVVSSFFGLFLGFEIWFYVSIADNTMSQHQQIFRLACGLVFALSSMLCSFHLWKNVNRSWEKLSKEKKRSEQLLLNILPSSIAQRLKHSSEIIADYFEQASIMFADIQNFTPMCKKLSPHQLVNFLNEVFTEFDNITQKHGLEKIKTNGDGYMVAGGVPINCDFHAIQCCYCALDMQVAFRDICKAHSMQTGLRIGIGCGEVIAGIIGKSKFSYDLWGEAVNLASRMESQGIRNKIQVTESIYNMTKHHFNFDKRDPIQDKGVGWTNTYWLISKKDKLGTDVHIKQLQCKNVSRSILAEKTARY